ncbi:MAG TPA: HTTM domain-containing protein, partial [Kofleriaceae bacterium]|nr:HTTM domain-containing protein [Kofleriaceae bacterium]
PRSTTSQSATVTPAASAAARAATPSAEVRVHGARAAVAPWAWPLEVSARKLALARFALFALVALDAILQLPHAPRYGAGGFALAHVPWLSALGPGRDSFVIAQGLISALAVAAALGMTSRAAMLALSGLYGWCYFGSQLDSYQHHYLVWIVVTLWAFVPAPAAQRAPAARGREDGSGDSQADGGLASVRSVALRLVLLQLGIMYLWAAVAKLDARWIDGTAMSQQLRGALRDWIDATMGVAVASRLVIVVELVLAVTVWRARAWRWALPLGVSLHALIAVSRLEIGLFSYLMMALYVLLLPEPLVARLAGLGRWWRRRSPWRAWRRGLVLGLVASAAALLLLVRPPLPARVAVGMLAVVVLLLWRAGKDAAALARVGRAALAAGVTVALWLVVDLGADVCADYYRYWGGAARRLGDEAQAERAYRGLVEVSPDQELGHFHLGRLLIRRGELEQGLAALREAERLAPRSTRALTEQARALTAAGRSQDAAEVAQRARRRERSEQPREDREQTGERSGLDSGAP